MAHILHDLKRAFKASTLDTLTEHESANKQIWSYVCSSTPFMHIASSGVLP